MEEEISGWFVSFVFKVFCLRKKLVDFLECAGVLNWQ